MEGKLRLEQVTHNIILVQEDLAALAVEIEGLERVSYILKDPDNAANKRFADLRKQSLQQRKKTLCESIDTLCASMEL